MFVLVDGVYNLFVGIYMGGGSDGIYVYCFDIKIGGVVLVLLVKIENLLYLLLSCDGCIVYVVNELFGDNGLVM